MLKEICEGICGLHTRARALATQTTRAGFYWPTLLKDAIKIKICDRFQRFTPVPHQPFVELTIIASL